MYCLDPLDREVPRVAATSAEESIDMQDSAARGFSTG
jgi:hypothetical protein